MSLKPEDIQMARAGRPSTYTPEIAVQICTRLANGESLRQICRDKGMPKRDTVIAWLFKNGGFSGQYALARVAQADFYADEILDIADGPEGDSLLDVNRSRLRVDTRKWLMARMAPKKYGDSLELDTPASPQSQYDFGRLSKKKHEDFMALLEIARVPDAVDTKFEDVKALTEGAE